MKNKITHLIVDLKPVLDQYDSRELHKFFRYLPLRDVISCMLSMAHYVDYSEQLYNAIDSSIEMYKKMRPDAGVDEFFLNNLDTLELLAENVIIDIDERVNTFITLSDTEYYLINDWLGDTSVILELHGGHHER